MRGNPRRTTRKRATDLNLKLSWPRVILGSLLFILTLVLLVQFWFLCKVFWYSMHPPASTPIMRATMAQLRQERPDATLRYQWVPYERISTSLKRAVVAAEDAKFMQHNGVDWRAVRDAWAHNRELAARRAEAEKAGKRPPRGVMRGASTITQQLAKNLFLSNDRTYFRKGQELVIAWMIEHVMTKQRILELYLNVAQWGNGVFGAEAAARHYFRASANQLGAGQAAQLAAMLPNPAFYDTHGPTSYLNSRTQTLAARARHAVIP